MKKVLIGIFAHPDDEAFGPSGTLYRAAQDGVDVHLLLATKGDAGRNCDDCEDLGAERLDEWHASGKLIGVHTQHYLGFKDGTLSNNLYLEIADEVMATIKKILAIYEESVSLEFLTFDQNGLSGHLDHIAISFITTFVYEKLRQGTSKNFKLGDLRYYCLCDSFVPSANTDWIYMPAGKNKEQVDQIIDITDVYEQKLDIMRAHKTQREDMETILKRYGEDPARFEECFTVYKG